MRLFSQAHTLMHLRFNATMSSLGERIKECRLEKELSQKKLGELVGIDQTVISKLERGDVSETSKIAELSYVLSVNAYWLSTGKGEKRPKSTALLVEQTRPEYSNISEKIPLGSRVPLISYVAAGDWESVVDNFEPGMAEEWLHCPVKHGDRTFALQVRGVSMYNPGGDKSFSEGDVIFIDPDIQPRHKHLVVAKMQDSQEATFKRLLIDGDKYFLEALNGDWKPRYQEINGNCKIVGVVIAKLESFI